MRHCIKSILTVTLLSFAAISFESNATGLNFSCGGSKKLNEKQCKALRLDLQIYTVLVKAIFGNGALVKAAIAAANKDVDKLCPKPTTPPPADDDNHYSPDSPFECRVVDDSGSLAISLGIDNNGALVNDQNPDRVLCMSQAACQNFVPQKFTYISLSSTSRCADPNDKTVLHLTDSEVQTKVNAVPAN